MSDIESITRKLEAFCAYQERCLFEIKNKLEEFDLSDSERALIISSLKTNKFWNEAYNCIRKYYPTVPIMIIDDNSNYDYVIPLPHTVLKNVFFVLRRNS